jgi:hypothetical protein
MEPPDFSALYALQYDVFLSYSWSDDAHARAQYGDLSGAMAVFFAPVDLPPEVQRQARFQFASLLMEALTRSAHFVALLSPRYLESAWCRLEMQGFANVHRRDAARRLWLFELQRCREQLPAPLRGLVFQGDREALLRTVQRTVRRGERPRGHDLGMPPQPCLPGLPLRRLYPPPKRAPWGFDSQSRGMPGAPPYEVYESLVREYMVQMQRRGRWGILAGPDDQPELEVPMEGLDPRYQRLSRRAKQDAEYLIGLKVDPYSDRRRYSDICAELMFKLGAEGENADDLHAMAECRSHMGADSCREALDIARRQLEAGADPARYRELRARAHYLRRDYQAAIDTLQVDGGALHLAEQLLLAAASAQLGDTDRAAAATAAALASEPGLNLADLRLNTMLEVDDDIEHWLTGLELAGLPAGPDVEKISRTIG